MIVAILFLLVAIGSALLVPGWLDRYLRISAAGDPAATPPGTATAAEWNGRPHVIYWCKAWANTSFVTLFIAGLFLALFAVTRLLNPSLRRDEATALSGAIALLGPFSSIAQPKWSTQSLTYIDKTDTYEILVLEETTKSQFKVLVPRGNAPISAQKVP